MLKNAANSSASDNSSERGFRLAVLLIGALAVAMLALQLLGHASILDKTSNEVFWAEVISEAALIGVITWASPVMLKELRRRQTAAMEAQAGRGEIELLFRMTDMLQSALGHADANAVLRSTAIRLMPEFGGALYIFNNSGDRLELSTSWNLPDAIVPGTAISPSECWAIKRGKLHLNQPHTGALCCDHNEVAFTTMEIPMMARGEIYGLLLLMAEGDDELRASEAAASALADAMSLSLSNIALRERLRTQALRDALTGLYNRRYMEDVLERYADQAERSQSPLSVLMIDLDHFKKLNDDHGHAMGDAVLSSAAAAIIGAIRPCDVACRYGGEELVILLPDCTLPEAASKADVLRDRIERLSDQHGMPISASFGIACVPSTSKAKDVLADADGALYRAKQEGRNRVVSAQPSLRGIKHETASRAA